LLLLRARAQIHVKNKRGKTPLSLCSDPGTKEVLDAFSNEKPSSASRQGSLEALPSPTSTQPLFATDRTSTGSAAGANVLGSYDESESTCEPFFVPRFPLFHDEAHRAEIVTLGMEMLNRSPGHGLAFLVASGAVHDHPTDLSAFVLKHGADPAQLGEFLGEDFSLAQTLRLAFIHSVDLKGTGIVSALVKAFRHIRAPPDLRKIDRLSSGIAHLWWRTHDEHEDDPWDDGNKDEDGLDWNAFCEDPSHVPVDGPDSTEAVGMELRRSFHSVEGFRRLMFSSVMLAWNLHAAPRIFPSAADPRRLTLNEWLDLNQGLEADGGNVPVHVQKGVFQKIMMGWTPQLLPDFSASSPPVSSERADRANSLADATCSVKGWASIPHGGLERLDPLLQGGHHPGLTNHGLAHCVFSETSSSVNQPLPSSTSGIVQPSRNVEEGGEAVWLSLRHSLFLFLSSSPNDPAPYASIRLQDAVLRDVDYTNKYLILAGRLKGPAQADDSKQNGNTPAKNLAEMHNVAARPLPFGDPRLPLPLCFLLADGRFQPFEALWLEIQFSSSEDLETWAREIGSACDCLDLQEKERIARDAGGKFNGPKGRGATRAPTVPLPGSPPPSPPVLAEERDSSRPESQRNSRTGLSPRPAG